MATKSVSLESENSKDESTKSESTESESSKGETSKNEISKSESSKGETSKNEISKSESTRIEISKSENIKIEISKSENTKNENIKSESSKSSSIKNKSPKDTREFPNNLPDYDGSDPILDSDGKLKQEFLDPIRECVLKLLSIIEKHIPREISWSEWCVYTGTAGIALTYMHAVEKKELFATEADDLTITYSTAFQLIEKSVPFMKKKYFSFMCGCSGPLTIMALLYYKMDKKDDGDTMFQRMINLERDGLAITPDIPNELLFGRIGYLYSLLLIRQETEKDEYADRIIKKGIDNILKSGKSWAKKKKNNLNFPLYYEWHDKAYIGAAHGFAGILYLLLCAKEFISPDDLDNLVKPSVDLILSLQFPSGNFPSSLGNESDRLIHWCHGAPGVIHLMLKSYKVFADDKYLNSAKQCADVIWKRGLLKKGYGLCHGVAGNGYAFLHIYQITKEKLYLHRAVQFGLWCCSYGKRDTRKPDHPLSLMEGMAGTIYYLIDLLDPEKASFPAFQLS